MPTITYTLDLKDTSKTGLSLSFSVFNKISDDSAVSAPSISELSSGFYKFSFDMDNVDSDLYFVADDGDSNYISGRLDKNNDTTIMDDLERCLGLTQENQFVDNTLYDGQGNLLSCRVRIYSLASSVGTVNDVIAEYAMTATYVGSAMSDFSMVKV